MTEPISDLDRRTKAWNRPIEGAYHDLAIYVRMLMGWAPGSIKSGSPFLTSRAASYKTGVNYSTIAAMTRGERAAYESIVKFTEALGGDVDYALLMGGYLPKDVKEFGPSQRRPQWQLDHSLRAAAIDLAKQSGKEFDVTVTLPNDTTGFLTQVAPDDWGDEDAELFKGCVDRLNRRELDAVRLAANVQASAGVSIPTAGDEETDRIGDYLGDDVEAIRVRGTCMEPVFHHGDIVLFRPQTFAQNGQKVIAHLDDDTIACKRYRQDEDGREYLQAMETGYPIIEKPHFRIVGVILWSMRQEFTAG